MKEFERCLQLKREIDDLTEKLYELRAVILSPKSQVITGMPRGSGGTEQPMDRYLIKSEQLDKKRTELIKQHCQLWQIIKPNGTEQEIELMFKRFFEGKSWNRCVNELNAKYGEWNINKAFRIYRKFSKNIQEQD